MRDGRKGNLLSSKKVAKGLCNRNSCWRGGITSFLVFRHWFSLSSEQDRQPEQESWSWTGQPGKDSVESKSNQVSLACQDSWSKQSVLKFKNFYGLYVLLYHQNHSLIYILCCTCTLYVRLLVHYDNIEMTVKGAVILPFKRKKKVLHTIKIMFPPPNMISPPRSICILYTQLWYSHTSFLSWFPSLFCMYFRLLPLHFFVSSLLSFPLLFTRRWRRYRLFTDWCGRPAQKPTKYLVCFAYHLL